MRANLGRLRRTLGVFVVHGRIRTCIFGRTTLGILCNRGLGRRRVWGLLSWIRRRLLAERLLYGRVDQTECALSERVLRSYRSWRVCVGIDRSISNTAATYRTTRRLNVIRVALVEPRWVFEAELSCKLPEFFVTDLVVNVDCQTFLVIGASSRRTFARDACTPSANTYLMVSAAVRRSDSRAWIQRAQREHEFVRTNRKLWIKLLHTRRVRGAVARASRGLTSGPHGFETALCCAAVRSHA